MVELVVALILCVDVTVLVHVRRSIAVVLLNEGIVKANLRIADLEIIVGIVETETIGERELLHQLDVGLNLTEHLLTIVVVVVVLDSPVGVGDTIRSIPSLGGVESVDKVLAVDE